MLCKWKGLSAHLPSRHIKREADTVLRHELLQDYSIEEGEINKFHVLGQLPQGKERQSKLLPHSCIGIGDMGVC